jgi:hypothetical protein
MKELNVNEEILQTLIDFANESLTGKPASQSILKSLVGQLVVKEEKVKEVVKK